MMTVALVKSVVETSGESATAAAADDAHQAKQHSYGLRKRNSKGRDSSSDEEEAARPARRGRKKTQPLKKRSVASTTFQKAENGPMSQGIQSTQQVPNPLLNNINAPPNAGTRVDAVEASVSDQIRPDGAPSAPVVMKPIEPGRRGRIFSIDIDTEGLEFPDMNIDVSMQPIPPGARIRSTSMEQGSQGDSSKSTSVTFKSGPNQHKDSLDVSLSSQTRGRAMSFEFFSFGINADEPLPPVPVISGTEQVAPAFQRPRGDSIIFEPDSFRDGGVLEEHALKSRTASLDLAPEEVALMNTTGFAPAPPTSVAIAVPESMEASMYTKSGNPTKSSRKSNSTSHSTNRTSTSCTTNKTAAATTSNSSLAYLNNVETPSHTSFQMELLNKDGRIGIYLPEARKARIAKFHSKRKMRIWRKRIKYDCRKKLADSRPRIKGRFVKRSDMDE
jgi:hypothetical protein